MDNKNFEMGEKNVKFTVEPQGEAGETAADADADEKKVPEVSPEEANEENIRGNWSNPIEFILSCIGYTVGLGNVWRFPFQCYRNGGGAFLVVYWILSFCVGFPIVFLEQSLGQFTSQGPTHCWGYAPIIRGIGYSMTALTLLACIYYNVIIAWSIFMLFASFQSTLPWQYCDFSSWADYRCEMQMTPCSSSSWEEVRAMDGLCYNATVLSSTWDHSAATSDFFNFTICPKSSHHDIDYSSSFYKETCINFFSRTGAKVFRNVSTVLGYWDEKLATANEVNPQLSTDQYFTYYVWRQTNGYNIDNIGTPSWGLILCLLLAWLIVFGALLNGVKTSGKVVYFTAVFPYVILFILIGRGVTLPGAYDGLMYYLTPKFEKMKDPSVWFAAANQLFFSMSCSWGGMIALASYNKFENNVLRDAIITAISDSGTSFIAGFAIFSIIGYGSHILNQPIDKVAKAGTALAFIMYPKVVLEMPGSVVWAIAFFFMLLLLGLDSQFNAMETILTALLDIMPWFRGSLWRKASFLGGLCILFFLLAIPMICNGGASLVSIVDEYSTGWGALITGVIELSSMGWLYGSGRYHKDLQVMLGSTWKDFGKYYLFIFWRIISPGIVTFILIYSFYVYKPIASNPTEEAIGWCCAAFVLVWPPVFAIYEIYSATPGSSFLERVKEKSRPNRLWGAYFVRHRRKSVPHMGPDFDIDPRNILKGGTSKQSSSNQFPEKSSLDLAEAEFGDESQDNRAYMPDISSLPPNYPDLDRINKQ